jgi:ATPase subunit of ABC transporter with duplicated ATPase domains
MPSATAENSTFHRNFESKAGYIQPQDFPVINWEKREDIELLLPFYRREQLRFDGEKKQRSKAVEIEGFNLKTPDGTSDLFVNTKLHVEASKRCAIFGINGSGKTTLFEAISSGSIRDWPSYIHVHHMKELEHNEQYDSISVMDTVICSHPLRRVLVPIVEHLTFLISQEKDQEKLSNLNSNLEHFQKALANVYGTYAEENARSMLRVLGFDETGEKAPLNSLSGGLRMRVALACSFFIKPDVLLLDEPTNHLDMPSVLWLENKLRGYSGSFLLVTHDRTLLENVVTSVMLIQDLGLVYYPCDFKEFQKRREKDDAKKEKMIQQFLARNTNMNPMNPLIKTANQYRAWLQARRDRDLLLQGKFTFQPPKGISCLMQLFLPLKVCLKKRFLLLKSRMFDLVMMSKRTFHSFSIHLFLTMSN